MPEPLNSIYVDDKRVKEIHIIYEPLDYKLQPDENDPEYSNVTVFTGQHTTRFIFGEEEDFIDFGTLRHAHITK